MKASILVASTYHLQNHLSNCALVALYQKLVGQKPCVCVRVCVCVCVSEIYAVSPH